MGPFMAVLSSSLVPGATTRLDTERGESVGYGIQGLGFRDSGYGILGFRVSRFRVWDSGFRVQGFRVWDLGFRVEGVQDPRGAKVFRLYDYPIVSYGSADKCEASDLGK